MLISLLLVLGEFLLHDQFVRVIGVVPESVVGLFVLLVLHPLDDHFHLLSEDGLLVQ